MIDESFHLTSLDVRRFDFGRSLRGYNPEKVEQFRDQVAEEIERLVRINQDLDTKARSFPWSIFRPGRTHYRKLHSWHCLFSYRHTYPNIPSVR